MRAKRLCMFSVAVAAVACPQTGNAASCPEFSGNFTIEVQDLFPESAAWDANDCRLYLSSAYNCTLVVYDPYAESAEVINIPNISVSGRFNFTEYHLNGVDYDAASDHVFVVAGSATSFTSTDEGDYSNANFTGPNHLLKFDAKNKRLLSDIQFDEVQATYLAQSGHRTNGFQDVAETTQGDAYVIGTYGNSIVRVRSNTSSPELWYVPENYNKTYGFGGIFANGPQLVVSDTITGGLVTFDTRKEKAIPREVPLENLPNDYRPLMADGLFAPTKYEGHVALWSDDYNGTSIYASNDGWATAHFLGLILNNDPSVEGGLTVASFEIGGRIFVLTEFFQMELPVESRKRFPIFDITDQVDDYVQKSTILRRSPT